MKAALVWLVACSTPIEPPVAERSTPEGARAQQRRDQPAPPSGPMTMRWVSVRSTPPCFYFSGPEGRDDQLVGKVVADRAELENGEVAITINHVKFVGTYRARELIVRRSSEHTFGGTWTVTEEIRGQFADGVLTGTYSYRECEHGTTCPGHCTIDADIKFER